MNKLSTAVANTEAQELYQAAGWKRDEQFYAAADTHVERVELFGFDCLRVDGKAFAKLHNGNLVMKLSLKRVASLIDSGLVGTYESRGRLMKEWVVIAAATKNIVVLAEESRGFAASK